ncbi:MarR family transcriptional regulator [Shewanella avicenniae]|uniref:MarR family transcriptional regulator n=1 Tax=Shewanella avicenniae TaxID=2814294 RepID=A0ABX7QND7_9GAMM|nr:MarR family transcriptional regulator [Shewanella avicenniae]QSX32874.1 MarR family transcriptional regulator [Shewanella avicenniae]
MEKHQLLLISLRKVIRAIDLHSRQLSKHSGLTGPQLMVMQRIAALGNPLVKQIAADINLSPATVTSIIDRLESKGFVIRERSTTDKRKVHLLLSDTGRALLDTAPAPLQEYFIERYQSLEDWEQSQLLAAVERIATMMDAQELDAAPVLVVGHISEDE